MPTSPDFVCDGCRVRAPWEHKCHGTPCKCSDCVIECSGCGAEAQEWATSDWSWSSPRPDGGLPDVYCLACQQKEADAEKALGLDRDPRETTDAH
jgi:hypothetical protein